MTHKIKIQTDDSQNDYQTINSLIEKSIESSKTLNWYITSTQSIKVFNTSDTAEASVHSPCNPNNLVTSFAGADDASDSDPQQVMEVEDADGEDKED